LIDVAGIFEIEGIIDDDIVSAAPSELTAD
jgi:hypothetical protein